MDTPSLASETPAQDEYRAGELIQERYRLLRPLSRGGMGALWVAHSLALDVKVAVKVLHGSLAGTEATERMAREARAVAKLGHPGILRVMDFGHTERGHPFIVSELLEGETLADHLDRQGRMDPVIAVRTLLPIVDAVWTAHEKGIVHRDLKPENIFLSRDDHGRLYPKVLDFGIAKLLDGGHEKNLTEVGLVVGSPAYMSPEQAYGTHKVDQRTDVWSLAVVLFEMVTAEMPFVGTGYHGLVSAIVHSAPRTLAELGVDDADLWGLVDRALRKHPDERFVSMRTFGEALAEWLHERAVDEDISGNSVRAKWLSGLVSDLDVSTDGSKRVQGHDSTTLKRREAPSGADAEGFGPGAGAADLTGLSDPSGSGMLGPTGRAGGGSSKVMLYGMGSAVITLVLLLVGYAVMAGGTQHADEAEGAGQPSAGLTAEPVPMVPARPAVLHESERPADPSAAGTSAPEPTDTSAAAGGAPPSDPAAAGATAPRPGGPGIFGAPPTTKTTKKKKGLDDEPDFGF